jgi:hypothetical protein
MVIPMREQQFRSHDQAVALPLAAEARGEVASFLEHGGNRFGRNKTPDAQAAGHKQILDDLGDMASLKIRADPATSDFCAIAAALCQAAPLVRKRTEYCWIFRQSNNLLTGLGSRAQRAPNAQIAELGANEARIYQLSPLE